MLGPRNRAVVAFLFVLAVRSIPRVNERGDQLPLPFVRRSYGDRAVDRQSLLVFDDDSLRFARSSERVEVTSYPLHFDDMTTDLCEGSGQPDCRTLFLFDDFIVVPRESE